eukprot:10825076-Alexandrium_andersonii.AAC.1
MLSSADTRLYLHGAHPFHTAPCPVDGGRHPSPRALPCSLFPPDLLRALLQQLADDSPRGL